VTAPETHTVRITVNGRMCDVAIEATQTLLEMLRWSLTLTGTKECCTEGECGACTVLVDGLAVDSCLVLAAEVDGREVVTIEGLEADGHLSAMQDAFLANGAVQCGFCTPGMIMAAQALLAANPSPHEAEIRDGLAGNLCRCAGYRGIIDAVRQAAAAPQGAQRHP
jgi:carbon-monoxide dehydrogenase small subunit